MMIIEFIILLILEFNPFRCKYAEFYFFIAAFDIYFFLSVNADKIYWINTFIYLPPFICDSFLHRIHGISLVLYHYQFSTCAPNSMMAFDDDNDDYIKQWPSVCLGSILKAGKSIPPFYFVLFFSSSQIKISSCIHASLRQNKCTHTHTSHYLSIHVFKTAKSNLSIELIHRKFFDAQKPLENLQSIIIIVSVTWNYISLQLQWKTSATRATTPTTTVMIMSLMMMCTGKQVWKIR